MRVYDATRTQWWRKLLTGFSIGLGLAGIGLSDSRAQMDYSGGLVPYRRHPSPYSLSEMTPPSPPERVMPPSYFPDNDFSYPSYSTATTSVARSYYPGAEAAATVGAIPFSVSAAALPWNQAGFEEYDPFPRTSPRALLNEPRLYTLAAVRLPRESASGQSSSAMLVVHLPEHVMLWFEGRWIPRRGPTSYLRSPPLNPTKKYTYSVRAAWIEDGHWVKQTQEVPVAAGVIQALYLRPSPAAGVKKPSMD